VDVAVDESSRVPAILNGLLVGIGGIVAIPQFMNKGTFGIFHYYPHIIDYLYAAYAGYTLYDLGTMTFWPGEGYAMWAHHLTGFWGSFFSMVIKHKKQKGTAQA
jgi:hypothetical protein